MIDLKIHAFDTLFFRDGKPFTMGENSVAQGIFPPPPSVFLGAFRSLYFSENLDKLSLANQSRDPTRDFAIRQFGLIHSGRTYFPAPLDLVKLKEPERQNKDQAFFLKESQNDSNLTSNPLPYVLKWSFEGNIESLENLPYLKDNEFIKYLQGNNPRFFELGKYIPSESRVGNKINRKTSVTEENMLYRIGMRRMNYLSVNKNGEIDGEIPSGFAISLDCNDYTFQNLSLRLGGEGKFANVNAFNFPEFNEFKLSSEGKFKLYLSTPAIFKNGWLPKTISPETLEGTINSIPVKVYAAAVGKPQFIGGWSWVDKAPKPMFKAVPQGSVYYLELLDKSLTTDELANKLQRNSISDLRQEEGFGIAYLANLQKD